jgi:hypothetical protein
MSTPDELVDAEAKLRKLGDRLRQVFAERQPLTDKQREAVHKAIRTDWILEKGRNFTPEIEPGRQREPGKDGPEMGD